MMRVPPSRWAGRMVLVASVALALIAAWLVTRPWPRMSGTVRAPGLEQEVMVVRDRWGVPHLYASTPHDLFFAQGYVHAQDRFAQMEVWRRLGSGRLSELFGERTLEQDRLARTLGWRRVAEAELRGLDDETRAALYAYAEGVNAHLRERGGRLGLEFTLLWWMGVRYAPDPWDPVDTLTWGKVMAWELGGSLRDDVLRAALVDRVGVPRAVELLPPYPEDRPHIVPGVVGADDGEASVWNGVALPPAAVESVPWEELDALGYALGSGPGLGSNNWVLAGSRTATGRPLLANDPHLRAQIPSVWYEVGMHCDPVGPGCPYAVVGASFPGMPGVVIGHNDRIAWGVTNANPDVQDLYVERTNPLNPDEYRVGERWVAMDVRYEEIIVRGEEQPRRLRVRATRHGPVINDLAGPAAAGWTHGWQPLALRWTGGEPGGMARAILAVDRAGDWEAFRAALRYLDVPSQNLVYADVAGNIGYQMTGRIPIRRNGSGAMPAPGWMDDYEWAGYVGYEDLPSALNPTDGSLVSANNRAVGPGFAHALGHDWNRGRRAARIEEMLAVRDAVSAKDCVTVQCDTLVHYADRLLRYLPLLTPDDARAKRAIALLERWDRHADPALVAPALFAAWHVAVSEAVFADELGEDVLSRYLIGSSSSVLDALDSVLAGEREAWCDDVASAAVETCAEMVDRAFGAALHDLEERLGRDMNAWRWGRLHRAMFTNATFGQSDIAPVEALFNRGPVAVGGTCDTVNNMCFDPRAPYGALLLPTYRQIIDVGAWENSLAINMTGQSGHAFHRHYDDMIPLWRDGEYHPMLWHREDIMRAAEGVLVLRP